MSNFKIDGKDMPKPSSWTTNPHIITADSERLAGSGRLITTYLTTVLETEWVYKYITQADYDILFDAYITSCRRNRSIEHTLTTIDSNTGGVISYKIYTQSDFKAPLYMVKNGVRYYRDITFTFVGVGGDS